MFPKLFDEETSEGGEAFKVTAATAVPRCRGREIINFE